MKGRERENEYVSLAMDAQKRNGTKEQDHETVMRQPEGGRKWRGRRLLWTFMRSRVAARQALQRCSTCGYYCST
jgi:hypothetical protein